MDLYMVEIHRGVPSVILWLIQQALHSLGPNRPSKQVTARRRPAFLCGLGARSTEAIVA